MKNATKNIVLSHLIILAAMSIGQADAATAKDKKVGNSLNPTLIKKSTSANPVKSNNKINTPPKAPLENITLPAASTQLASDHINRPSARPNVKPSLQHQIGKSNMGIQKHNLQNQHKELNGQKRLNPIEALNPAGINANNPTLAIPGKRGSKSSKDLYGTARHGVASGSAGVVVDHRGGVSTFRPIGGGKQVMFPTPEGGSHTNPESNRSLAEMSRVGNFYVIEAEGTVSYIPVGDVQNDSAGNSDKPEGTASGIKNPSESNDSGNDTSNNSSNDSDTNADDDSSNDSGNDSDTDSSDDSSNDADTDSGDDSGAEDTDTEEGATENYGSTSPGGFNSNPSSSIAYCAANPYDSSCKQTESTQPGPCGEDDGSGRVSQPGPEGGGDCVPSIGNRDDDDDDDSAPRAEDNLPVSPTQTAEDRRNQVINPTGFEEDRREDRNFAVETLEAIEQTVNPGDR